MPRTAPPSPPPSSPSPSPSPSAGADRLARFEAVLAEIVADRADADRQLARLRGEGRSGTVRFKELLARKLTDQRLQILFQKHGIDAGLSPDPAEGGSP